MRAAAKARGVKGYYKMNKSQLMQATGMGADRKAPKGDKRAQSTARKSGAALSFGAGKLASKYNVRKEDLVKDAQKALRKAQKAKGSALTPQEKRKAVATSLRKSTSTDREMVSMVKKSKRDGTFDRAVESMGGGKPKARRSIKAKKEDLSLEDLGRQDRRMQKSMKTMFGESRGQTEWNRMSLESQYDPSDIRIEELGDGKIQKQFPKKAKVKGSPSGALAKKRSTKKEKSLGELFKEADRVGSKYQKKGDPIDMGAKRAAKKIYDESGMGGAIARAKGKSKGGLTAIAGGKSSGTKRQSMRSAARDLMKATGNTDKALGKLKEQKTAIEKKQSRKGKAKK